MFKKDQDTEYLLGSKIPTSLPTQPFDGLTCKFLEIFSKKIGLLKNIKKYPDLKTLSFWCRKGNINNLKKKKFIRRNKNGPRNDFSYNAIQYTYKFCILINFWFIDGQFKYNQSSFKKI